MSREDKLAWGLSALILGVVLMVMIMSGCTGNDAREDLDTEDQRQDNSEAVIAIFPDGFPNVAHKCIDFGRTPVGMFSTTDRFVILIYNDHACPGSNIEQPQEVINMGSRQAVAGS